MSREFPAVGGGGRREAPCSCASAKMAAAAGSCARLAAWGGRLRRGLAASRRALPSPGPLAAAVAGAALAGVGAAWHHSRVNVAARDGSLAVSAQVRDELLLAPVKLLPPLTPFGGEWFGAGRLSRSRGSGRRCVSGRPDTGGTRSFLDWPPP